jgi:ribosomal protein S18 acetylase RimI-like enzyme
MEKIIRLNRKHSEQLAQVDFESEHPVDAQRNLSKTLMKKYILKRFDQGHELFFGLKSDEELIGYVTLIPFFPGHKHCEVFWLAVRKKYQKQGVGKRLMRFIEQHAKKNGFRKVCLYTGKDMKWARYFYEKIGYEFVNEFPGYYSFSSGNTTAVLYAKEVK